MYETVELKNANELVRWTITVERPALDRDSQ